MKQKEKHQFCFVVENSLLEGKKCRTISRNRGVTDALHRLQEPHVISVLLTLVDIYIFTCKVHSHCYQLNPHLNEHSK